MKPPPPPTSPAMSPPTVPPPPATPATRRAGRAAAVALAGLMLGGLVLPLGLSWQLGRATDAWRLARQAQDDLARGALHLALGDAGPAAHAAQGAQATGPWQRALGLPLIDQGVAVLQRLPAEDTDPATLAGAQAAFASEAAAGAAAGAAGRAALAALLTAAQRQVDRLGQQQQRLQARQAWAWWGGGGLWLAGLAVVSQAGRRSRRSLAQLQQALDTVSVRHRELLDALPDGVLILRAGRVVFHNAAFARLLGLPPGEAGLLERPLASLLAPGSGERWLARASAATPEAAPSIDELGLQPPQGGPVCWVELRSRCTRVAGEPALLCLVRDIRDRRRQAEELAAYRLQLEGLLAERSQDLDDARAHAAQDRALSALLADHLPLVAVYWDRARRCRFATRRFADWWRQDLPALIGRPMAEVVSAERIAANEAEIRQALAGEPVHVHRPVQTPDGRWIQARLDYTPDWRDGAVQGFFFVLTDDTELKQAEQRLQQANEALVRARDAAEAATQARGGFLAAMSHELRTPLNAILVMNHLLRQALGGTPHEARLAKVGDAAQHLLAILNDVLDLSTIDAGRLVLVPAVFDRDAWLQRCVDMVLDPARQAGLELVIDLVHVPSRLLADATRLTQAVLNLLGNAVKFTERGWVGLRIERLPDAPGQAEGQLHLRFSVQDSGPGIPAEQLPQLFTSYVRAIPKIGRRPAGTGLGLAITRRLAEAMGGTAGVESVEGVGSRFWFTAVLTGAPPGGPAAGDAHDAPALDTDTGDDGDGPQDLAGLQVLVVDDLPPARRAISGMLARAGAQVQQAADAAAARAVLAARPPDWVLIDGHLLDEADGPAWPALTHLAAAAGTRVLLTWVSDHVATGAGAGPTADADEALARVHGMLWKPLTPRRLRDAMAPGASDGAPPGQGRSQDQPV